MFNQWLAWFFAVFQTSIQWLVSMKINGIPVIAIIVAVFIMGVIMSALIYKV